MGNGRNRRDHYLPQGYLRGFIDPARSTCQQPLWHFDIPNQIWSERSSREIGYRHGFYDYGDNHGGLKTADSAFAELEGRYPRVRRELVSGGFRNWRTHLEFFLEYIQMMRSRSLLFFEQKLDEGKQLKVWVIKEIAPDRKSVKLESMIPRSPSGEFIRNWSLTEMRAQIEKGAAWLHDFNWALRHCDSVLNPFITCEIPVLMSGQERGVAEALQNPETLLFFPLCWQACLIARRQVFETDFGRFETEDMQRVRKIYRESAKLFLVSPVEVQF